MIELVHIGDAEGKVHSSDVTAVGALYNLTFTEELLGNRREAIGYAGAQFKRMITLSNDKTIAGIDCARCQYLRRRLQVAS